MPSLKVLIEPTMCLSQVRDITAALRECNAAIGMVSAAYRVREDVQHTLSIFRANAFYVEKFPLKDDRERLIYESVRKRYQTQAFPWIELETKPTEMAHHLLKLSLDLKSLATNLHDISELADGHRLIKSILSFSTDLKVIAAAPLTRVISLTL